MSARTATRAKQSQPYTGPERIEVPAIRIDGHIVEGRTEHEAIARAVAAGLITERQIYDSLDDGEGRVETGYLTSRDRLVSGKEALHIARQAGQLRRNSMFNRESGAISLNSRRYWGMFSQNHLKGLKKSCEFNELPNAVSGEIRGGEKSRELHIVSRALQIPDGKGGTFTHDLKWFSETGKYVGASSEKPMHAIEGYKLSDDTFITRDEARKMFAGADIGPEGRRNDKA